MKAVYFVEYTVYCKYKNRCEVFDCDAIQTQQANKRNPIFALLSAPRCNSNHALYHRTPGASFTVRYYLNQNLVQGMGNIKSKNIIIHPSPNVYIR